MKNLCFVLFLIFSILQINAQRTPPFGEVSLKEKRLTTYEKDSLANAVVLFEKGTAKFEVIGNRVLLVKEYHHKIKVLKKEGFDQANINIPFYHNSRASEKIYKIEALTHNGDRKSWVGKDKFFTADLSERWKETRFTFPEVRVGSILEYRYVLHTPFHFKLESWAFQSDIPKIYSEFTAEIPGNYVYNRSIYGSLKLDVHDNWLKRSCFYIPGSSEPADCEVVQYGMKDIPAFESEEDYMLAASNYLARVDFELSEYHGFNGNTDRYTKTWKDVDKEYRSDKDFGKQLTKKGFFEKSVPEKLFVGTNGLEKARKIYDFVQDHYSWNGVYGIYRNIRVKEAFAKREGNIGEINISLINLLNAAEIPTKLVLLSTRANGLPRKAHPVMSDFNYVVALASIDGKEYLLDASDKLNPFGMLPFRCLNHYGRVMDFKNDSYWYDIVPEAKNRHLVRTQIKFDLENGLVSGLMDDLNLGYSAYRRNKELQENRDDYLSALEDAMGNNFEVTNYTLKEVSEDKKKVSERFEFEMDSPLKEDKLFLNPFLVRFFSKNPFTSENRTYPVDFGFPRYYSYQATIVIPEGYKVLELPEMQMVSLNGNGGTLKFNHMANENQITLLFDFKLNSYHFVPEEYDVIKAIFAKVVELQNNALIVLEKKAEN